MMSFLIKHKVKIFLITILGFFAGTFVGFGSYFFGDKNYFDTVAVVNGYKIPYKLYYALYNNTIEVLRKSNPEINDDTMKKIQSNVVNSLILDEILWQQTKKYGVSVSENELLMDIQNHKYFLNDQGVFDPRYYFNVLNNLKLTPKEFENMRKKQIAANKMKILIASAISDISESELKSMKTINPNITKAYMLQLRNNEILNDWFDKIRKETSIKITMSDKI
ncbi:MAG: SurA N-terminal domain-containing protein [Endomicrobiaceae bacterium]|nr:SurA N-terminal domain-containing protein [Endomicrobiaceae bacterium]